MTTWLLLASGLALLSLAYGSRATCELDSRPCLKGDYSSCQDGTCKCDPGYKGLGELRCVPTNRHICTLLNDPHGLPFSGKGSADVSLPCRFLATDVTVRRENNFWCRTRIFAYGWRFRGKIYMSGYDIRLDWEGDDVDRYTLSLKAYGRRKGNGPYKWDLLSRHSRFLGGDKWQRDDIALTPMDVDLGGVNHFGVDEANNRVQFSSSVCGIDTAFRLPDPEAGQNQPELPGLFIAVNPDAGEVEFNDVEGSVCLTPTLGAGEAAAAIDPAADIDDAFLFKTSAYDRGQAFPKGDTKGCTKLQKVTSKCPEGARTVTALNQCSFIMQKPKFLNCFSDDANSADAIQLFRQCMNAFCNNDGNDCAAVKSQIMNKPRCYSDQVSPDAANFIANVACPQS